MAYRESPFGRLVNVGWGGGIVVMEMTMPASYVRYESLDPVYVPGAIGGGRYAIGAEIPAADYAEWMFFEALDPDGFPYRPVVQNYTAVLLEPEQQDLTVESADQRNWRDYYSGPGSLDDAFSGGSPSTITIGAAKDTIEAKAIAAIDALEQAFADFLNVIEFRYELDLSSPDDVGFAELSEWLIGENRTIVTTSVMANLRHTRLAKIRQAVFFDPGFAPHQYDNVVRLRAYAGGTFSVGADKKLANEGGTLLWEWEGTVAFVEAGVEIVEFDRSGATAL